MARQETPGAVSRGMDAEIQAVDRATRIHRDLDSLPPDVGWTGGRLRSNTDLPKILHAEPYLDPSKIAAKISCRSQTSGGRTLIQRPAAKPLPPALYSEPFVDQEKLARSLLGNRAQAVALNHRPAAKPLPPALYSEPFVDQEKLARNLLGDRAYSCKPVEPSRNGANTSTKAVAGHSAVKASVCDPGVYERTRALAGSTMESDKAELGAHGRDVLQRELMTLLGSDELLEFTMLVSVLRDRLLPHGIVVDETTVRETLSLIENSLLPQGVLTPPNANDAWSSDFGKCSPEQHSSLKKRLSFAAIAPEKIRDEPLSSIADSLGNYWADECVEREASKKPYYSVLFEVVPGSTIGLKLRGTQVTCVEPGSLAHGIVATGDHIISVNGCAVSTDKNSNDFDALVAEATSISLSVLPASAAGLLLLALDSVNPEEPAFVDV